MAAQPELNVPITPIRTRVRHRHARGADLLDPTWPAAQTRRCTPGSRRNARPSGPPAGAGGQLRGGAGLLQSVSARANGACSGRSWRPEGDGMPFALVLHRTAGGCRQCRNIPRRHHSSLASAAARCHKGQHANEHGEQTKCSVSPQDRRLRRTVTDLLPARGAVSRHSRAPSNPKPLECVLRAMPKVGLEPTRGFPQPDLSPARLPIPPLRRGHIVALKPTSLRSAHEGRDPDRRRRLPGLNAVIRAAGRSVMTRDGDVVGVLEGWKD